ncbi:MAG: indole-3-glycerol phosphate synthase TrpC [Planctomycetes bacterium]|nr:indole-3-glycerol phosphate synthase TrpC [Planctomycetota bacterium]
MLHRILEEILAHKRGEVAAAKARRPLAALEAALAKAPPARDFAATLRHAHARDGVALIAEIKRKSPSAGLIRPAFHPTRIARTYEAHGAAAISVLTDERFFGGSLAILRHVRRAVGIPVLRKDFLLDPYQLVEARAAGADAALLITEALGSKGLRAMLAEARGLGLPCLVECHCLSSLKAALDAGADIVGINNRDLHTFTTKLETTRRLAARIAPGKLIVSESAIRTHADVERVAAWGAHAILVGEALMRRRDIGQAVDELMGIRGSSRSRP